MMLLQLGVSSGEMRIVACRESFETPGGGGGGGAMEEAGCLAEAPPLPPLVSGTFFFPKMRRREIPRKIARLTYKLEGPGRRGARRRQYRGRALQSRTDDSLRADG